MDEQRKADRAGGDAGRPVSGERSRTVEFPAVKTTIVGGRPPGCGKAVGEIPRGIEVLVKKAAVDPAFKITLLTLRSAAADQIGLTLAPAEAAMLNVVPGAQLEAIIARTRVDERIRPAFLGKVAGVMLVALGAASLADPGCVSFGIQPDEAKNRNATTAPADPAADSRLGEFAQAEAPPPGVRLAGGRVDSAGIRGDYPEGGNYEEDATRARMRAKLIDIIKMVDGGGSTGGATPVANPPPPVRPVVPLAATPPAGSPPADPPAAPTVTPPAIPPTTQPALERVEEINRLIRRLDAPQVIVVGGEVLTGFGPADAERELLGIGAQALPLLRQALDGKRLSPAAALRASRIIQTLENTDRPKANSDAPAGPRSAALPAADAAVQISLSPVASPAAIQLAQQDIRTRGVRPDRPVLPPTSQPTTAPTSQPAAGPITEAELPTLLMRLDDKDFAVREAAEKRLIAQGQSWLPQLRKVAESKSLAPEAQWRLGRVLDTFMPPALVAEIDKLIKRLDAPDMVVVAGMIAEPIITGSDAERRLIEIGRRALPQVKQALDSKTLSPKAAERAARLIGTLEKADTPKPPADDQTTRGIRPNRPAMPTAGVRPTEPNE